MSALRSIALACACVVLPAAAAHPPQRTLAAASFTIANGPYLPGSRIRADVNGLHAPFDLVLLGPGGLKSGEYRVPDTASGGSATLIAANASGLALKDVALTSAPTAARPLLAVASYDEGVVLHDPATFARLGTLGIVGAPSDVSFGPDGRFAATDTSGATLTIAERNPWRVYTLPNVPQGNEVRFDTVTNAVFVTNRFVDGAGALTRVLPDGSTMRVATGDTAEGLAVDDRRGIVYVGNVNDGTVAAIDAVTMTLLRRIPAVPRVFGLALSEDGSLLYAVANRSAASQFRKPGYVAVISLRSTPRIVARSANLDFPVGIALDAARNRVFVTDEGANVVYVLDAHTLRAVHAPLQTCETPWKPTFDAASDRVYIPCARSNQIDVFDARTLRRIVGAPFATGGYPLAVAVWQPTHPMKG